MNSSFLSPVEITGIVSGLCRACSQNFIEYECAAVYPLMAESERRAFAARTAEFFDLGDLACRQLAQAVDFSLFTAHVLDMYAQNPARSLTFRTSGSTDAPRCWQYSWGQLREEAQSLAPYFAQRRRVVSVMPTHHIFGFAFAVMLPKNLGIPVKLLPALPTEHFLREIAQGDLVLGFPAFWTALLSMRQRCGAGFFPADVWGVSSSAPCPREVVQGLQDVSAQPAGEGRSPALAAMVEIYGATEFGAVGIRQDSARPYELLAHWQRVDRAETADIQASECGILRQSTRTVMPLPDVVEWEDGRHFRPLMRKDNAVQVAGFNVYPARVADLLRAHPAVEDCAVRLMRPEEGTRLKAFVKPVDDGVFAAGSAVCANLRRALQAWLRRRLNSAAVPKSIVFGRDLPKTISGKSADWNI